MVKSEKIKNFIEKATKIHGNKYDYSLVEYINSRTKITIICKKHGEFLQTVDVHLSNHGCQKCGMEKTMTKINNFIEKGNKIHNFKYDYSLLIDEFINTNNKIKIICDIHGIFEQVAGEHLRGSGCKNCSYLMNNGLNSKKIRGNNRNLYLIKCWNINEEFYKIGITNKTIKQRFRNLIYEFEILQKINIDNNKCLSLEKEIHRTYQQFKYIPNIKFSGYTECYNTTLPIITILNLYFEQ